MTQFSKLKKGEILSESSYFTVKEVKSYTLPTGERMHEAVVIDAHGNEGEINKKYIETIMKSANQYTSTEKMSRTDVIKKLEENPRISCSVYFRKKDGEKKVGAFKAEVAAKIAEAENATVKQIGAIVENLIKDPLTKVIPGEMRLIKGYHHSTRDAAGRLQFTDMEALPIMVKGVDTRTIEYIIVDNVKYEVK